MIHHLRKTLEVCSPGPWEVDQHLRIVVPDNRVPSDEILRANLGITVAARNVLPLLLDLWEAVEGLCKPHGFVEDGDDPVDDPLEDIQAVEHALGRLNSLERPPV